MASLAPCDSASNCEDGKLRLDHSGEVVASPLPILDLFKGVSSPALVSSLTPVVMRVCDLYGAYLSTVDAVDGRSRCSNSSGAGTPASESGSAVSSSSVSFSSGPSGRTVGSSKRRSARRAMAWRQANVPRNFPQGFCYSRYFRSTARECVAGDLKEWPAVNSMLLQPAEFGQHPCMLDDYRLSRVADGMYHLSLPSEASSDSVSANDALVGCARRYEYPVGTYGHLLRTVSRVGASDEVMSLLDREDKIGGTIPVGGVSEVVPAGSSAISVSMDPRFRIACLDLSVKLVARVSSGIGTDADVEEYRRLLGEVVALKRAAPPGYVGFGRMWDNAELYCRSIDDTTKRQVVEFEFLFGSDSVSVRDVHLDLLRRVYAGYSEERNGAKVTYIAPNRRFQTFSSDQLAAAFQLFGTFSFSVSERLKFASYRLAPK